MSNTTSIRKVSALPDATGRNKASVRYDTSDNVLKISNGTNWLPLNVLTTKYTGTNATLQTQPFFIADRALQVTAVKEVHGVAGSDAGAVTIAVTRDTGTAAPGAGAAVLAASMNAKSTANTVVTPALNATAANLLLAAGDRLSVKFTGTLTALDNVVVNVTLKEV